MGPRLPRPLVQPFICPRCRQSDLPQRTSLRSTRKASTSTSSKPRYTNLSHRSLLRLNGPDAASYLHNLLPVTLTDLSTRSGPIYTVFLSAHGRILNDVFVYPPKDGGGTDEWLVEVDASSMDSLFAHLKKHKLRSKFKLERVDGNEARVWYLWPDVDGKRYGSSVRGEQDPRPGMGRRWVETRASPSKELEELKGNGEQATEEEYKIHRMVNGISEGQIEIFSGSSLPQESNIDFFGGIDFHKGCYLGQELTIRTHHTGVVRKRILPCQIYSEGEAINSSQVQPMYQADSGSGLPPSGSNISKVREKGKGRSTGKWLDGVGNIGLALCRLEMMTDIQLESERTSHDPNDRFKAQWGGNEDGTPPKEVFVKPFVPTWLRDNIASSLRRRERRPKKPEEEEDDEAE